MLKWNRGSIPNRTSRYSMWMWTILGSVGGNHQFDFGPVHDQWLIMLEGWGQFTASNTATVIWGFSESWVFLSIFSPLTILHQLTRFAIVKPAAPPPAITSIACEGVSSLFRGRTHNHIERNWKFLEISEMPYSITVDRYFPTGTDELAACEQE